MKLNQLKVSGQHPKWCGPSALSIMTGRTVNHCAKLIAWERNTRIGWFSWYKGKGSSKQVKGVDNSEMKRALSKMGFIMERVEIPRHHHRHQVMSINPDPFVMPTLHRYMRERGGSDWKAVMLVEVTGHYLVINRDTVSDNHQQDKHYTKHRWSLKKIARAWIVKRKPKR